MSYECQLDEYYQKSEGGTIDWLVLNVTLYPYVRIGISQKERKNMITFMYLM